MTHQAAPDAATTLASLSDILTPWAVRTAATLRLADHLTAGADRLGDLVAATGTNRRTLTALVQHLVDRGVLTLTGDVVGLTPVGDLLRSDVPGSWRAHLDLTGAPGLMQQAWSELPTTVRTGGPAVPGGLWARIGDDPMLAASFADWLGDWADEWTPAVAAALDLPPGSTVLDVGGGDGRLLTAVLRAHPTVDGTLVELPATAQLAQQRLITAGLGSRALVHAGDFFDDLPTADTVVLAQVLHDWTDADAARLLHTAAGAVAVGGRLVVVERLADQGAAPAMDLLMASLFGSHERTADEFDALATGAGLVPTGRTSVGHGLHLLTYRPRATRPPEDIP